MWNNQNFLVKDSHSAILWFTEIYWSDLKLLNNSSTLNDAIGELVELFKRSNSMQEVIIAVNAVRNEIELIISSTDNSQDGNAMRYFAIIISKALKIIEDERMKNVIFNTFISDLKTQFQSFFLSGSDQSQETPLDVISNNMATKCPQLYQKEFKQELDRISSRDEGISSIYRRNSDTIWNLNQDWNKENLQVLLKTHIMRAFSSVVIIVSLPTTFFDDFDEQLIRFMSNIEAKAVEESEPEKLKKYFMSQYMELMKRFADTCFELYCRNDVQCKKIAKK